MTYTREEIIDKLKNYEMGWEKPKYETAGFWHDVLELLEKAEALNKATASYAYECGKKDAEPCDDAISRERAIEALDGDAEDTLSYASARNVIRELPSVQPSIDLDKHDEQLIKETVANIWGKEPSKGHWIVGSDTDIKGETVYWFTCSECKSDRGQHTNYCPDCGAKMDNTCEVTNDSTDVDKQ